VRPSKLKRRADRTRSIHGTGENQTRRLPSTDPRLVESMRSWLAEKTGRDDLDCPVCGQTDFGVGAVMFLRSLRDAPRVIHDGDVLEGWGVIPVACNSCGYTMLFDFEQCAPSLAKEYIDDRGQI
jgi:predicted nucleic-acid-binding Zn-ribbon protein